MKYRLKYTAAGNANDAIKITFQAGTRKNVKAMSQILSSTQNIAGISRGVESTAKHAQKAYLQTETFSRASAEH